MEAMAGVIAASFGVPAAMPVVKMALAVCWAFAESILDLRELLDGGKVALFKTAESWALSGTASETAGNRGSEQKKCTGRHGVFRLSAAAFDAEIGKSGNVWSDGSGGIQYADRTAAAGFPTGLLCR